MKRLIATTTAATLLFSGLAIAAEQKTGQDARTPDASAQQQEMKPESKEQAATPAAGSLEFVTSQEDSDWLASSLIGRRVQNANGDTLGNINDVVFDEGGSIDAVLIGVGGFLGIGEKEVAVHYDALTFKQREIKKPAGKDAREDALQQNTRPPSASGGDPSRMAAERNAQDGRTAAPRKDAGHGDMVIVLNATKEQLEAAPAYVKLGETAEAERGGEQDVNRDAKEDQPKTQ